MLFGFLKHSRVQKAKCFSSSLLSDFWSFSRSLLVLFSSDYNSICSSNTPAWAFFFSFSLFQLEILANYMPPYKYLMDCYSWELLPHDFDHFYLNLAMKQKLLDSNVFEIIEKIYCRKKKYFEIITMSCHFYWQ